MHAMIGPMILNLTTRNEPGAAELPPHIRDEVLGLLHRPCPENSLLSVRTAIALAEIALHNGLGPAGKPDPVPHRVLLDGQHPASHRAANELMLRGVAVSLASAT
jgi:hypothetical protein